MKIDIFCYGNGYLDYRNNVYFFKIGYFENFCCFELGIFNVLMFLLLLILIVFFIKLYYDKVNV